MVKINYTSLTFGVCLGTIFSVFGGYDKYLKALMLVIILDFLTGIIKSIYTKSVSSKICYIGICKKIIILILISLSVMIEDLLGIPVRYITLMFFIVNESISILENASVVVPIPDKLVDVIYSIRKNVPENQGVDKEIEKK